MASINNIKTFRELSGVTKKELARLLNVTVHTYSAYEVDNNAIPAVIGVMLSMIYKISIYELFCPYEQVEKKSLDYIMRLRSLETSTRFDILSYNILGNSDHKPTYHWIQEVKERIRDEIMEIDEH